MAKQLEVLKADGSLEEYLHTKVLGTINNAFDQVGTADVFLAQELSEVVTYYLYHDGDKPKKRVASDKILSIIKVVLTTTGHDAAAAALSAHHNERCLKRKRIEVVFMALDNLSDARLLCDTSQLGNTARWDKSHITHDLIEAYDIPRHCARTIASMVEDRVFKMGINIVPASLIKLLMLNDAAQVLHAQDHLQAGCTGSG